MANGWITLDGNEAVASVAYQLSDAAAIYPITPASPMGEHFDAWASGGRTNLWGETPEVVEMQSEAGAAGAVHGALQAGSLATTFTASQGLLLMLPNLYKIAGELTPCVVHVAARTVATHALSIFGDHSDVMSCRGTGMAMLASASVQEAQDMACVAHLATLEARVPFLHFFDGFRTSHEVAKIHALAPDELRALVDEDRVREHRERALTPDRPVLRGSAQNPDVFFQAREAANPFHDACAEVVTRTLDRFAEITGRRYGLFDYAGDPEAERVICLMGSGADAARETVEHLVAKGEKVGVLAVRLYRPFDVRAFGAALPKSARRIAVLDRTKEPGAVGEPLFQDVVCALHELAAEDGREVPDVIGGRYGLSSKEFTPAMVATVFDELASETPRRRFTVGIVDDVTRLSLPLGDPLDVEQRDVVRAVFFGLGSDGTVGANKNSIKIIGQETDLFAQGYFVYDSKKSGAVTVSHLRFGPHPIRSSYLIERAEFVACHHVSFLERYEVFELAAPGATVLINAATPADELWDQLPAEAQELAIERDLKIYSVDAGQVAREAGLGGRINTVMQTCFFALSGVLPRDKAIEAIKGAIQKSYASKGGEVVRRNEAAVDGALDRLHPVPCRERVSTERRRPDPIDGDAPDFVKRVTGVMMAGKGDLLPTSAFPPDGTWPTGTARFERRRIAHSVPIWDPAICIQCNKCAFVCPHAAIRAKVYGEDALADPPSVFRSVPYRAKDQGDVRYTIQLSPEDCTGCTLCVEVCPAKDKANPRHKAIDMQPLDEVVDDELESWRYFERLPVLAPESAKRLDVKTTQLLEPLFTASGACAGCGETPYLKLLTQLYGDRLLIANATGCSSIYGGNLPTTPWSRDAAGRGPAWANSLFEDNAEFGFGMRVALDGLRARARNLLRGLAGSLGDEHVGALLAAEQTDAAGIAAQRERVASLRDKLSTLSGTEASELAQLADYLVEKSVWLVGGDGWAYDIGYGGLDHVLSSTRDVNVLVLDTEVYSNTGGQASKATPLGAAAKFAAHGKPTEKKDLGLMAMAYGHVYVASIAFGAKDKQTVDALVEAGSYPGPSLVIAYSHCIAHGYDLRFGADQQQRAVQSGIWPLYRYDPRRIDEGEPPLEIDAKGGRTPVQEYMRNETRFRMVQRIDAKAFQRYAKESQAAAKRRLELYRHLAALRFPAASTQDTSTNGSGERT